jgi:hypothetical protein
MRVGSVPVILLVTIVCGSCGKSDKAPASTTCEQVADHIRDVHLEDWKAFVAKLAPGKTSDNGAKEAEEIRVKEREEVAQNCSRSAWTSEERTCVAKATTYDQIAACGVVQIDNDMPPFRIMFTRPSTK